MRPAVDIGVLRTEIPGVRTARSALASILATGLVAAAPAAAQVAPAEPTPRRPPLIPVTPVAPSTEPQAPVVVGVSPAPQPFVLRAGDPPPTTGGVPLLTASSRAPATTRRTSLQYPRPRLGAHVGASPAIPWVNNVMGAPRWQLSAAVRGGGQFSELFGAGLEINFHTPENAGILLAWAELTPIRYWYVAAGLGGGVSIAGFGAAPIGIFGAFLRTGVEIPIVVPENDPPRRIGSHAISISGQALVAVGPQALVLFPALVLGYEAY